MACHALCHTTHTAVGFFQSDEQEGLSDLSEISTPALTNGLFPPSHPLFFNRSLQETTTAVISLDLTSPSTVLISRRKFSS